VDGLIASRIDRLVLAVSGPAIVVAGGRFTFQFSGEWRVEQNQERATQIYALAAKPSGWVEKFFVEA
jgi:hypothetical protein